MTLNRRELLKIPVAACLSGLADALPAAEKKLGDAMQEYDKPLFNLHAVSKDPVTIKSIELLRIGNGLFVRSTSQDGTVGLSMTKSTLEDFIPVLLNRIIPFFTGKDARDLETLVDLVYIENYKMAGQALWVPVASVEQSLWDLLGKTAGKSIAQLMGGVLRTEIPVYLSGSGRETTAEEEVDVYARGVEHTNAKAVKFKIGGRMSRNADVYPGRTETMLKLARKRLGPGIVINVDANGSYNAAKAIEVGKFLHDLNVFFYEEPCPWQEYSETRKTAEALAIKIACGEQDSNLWQFQWMMENGVIDIVQPDLNYNGGFIRAARVARLARKHKMPITPHNTQTGPTAVNILQFASAIPNIGDHMEYPWREPAKPASWYSPNFEIKDGVLKIPKGPGLGIEFDPDYISKAMAVAS
ncbi:MAG: mandelate racemase/muconate lactonizing enzyme family protein [Bryobacteraceae bacterium]